MGTQARGGKVEVAPGSLGEQQEPCPCCLPLIPELMLVPALCPNEPRAPWGHRAMLEPRGRAVPR